MSDLIDRQAAIATAVSGRVRTLPTTEDGEDWIRVNEVRDSLLSLPSAQPEVRRGRWIYWDKNRVMCSECKLEPYAGKGADSFKYCPHCGAKMEA